MPKKPKLTIKGSFTQRQPDGALIGLEFHGVVDTIILPKDTSADDKHYVSNEERMKKIYEVVVEGEMHGNDGKTRVHIFLQ